MDDVRNVGSRAPAKHDGTPSSWRRTLRRSLAPAAVLVALGACGGVTIKKIPWKGDYSSWNDDRQKEVDGIKGTRYYLPWPTLVVSKEFPVATSACFVPGTLSGDGKYILLDNDTIKFLNSGGAQPFTSPALVTAPGGGGGGLQAATSSLADSGAGEAKDAGGGKEAGGMTFETDGGGGSASASSTSGNGTQPIILSESLSLEYLPDERQQYAVETSGTVQDMKMQLTNGWMLESPDYHVDNSAVIKLIEDTVGSALTAASKLVPGLQAQVSSLVASGGGNAIPVTVKVHTISYAVPGLYPKLRAEDQDKVANLALQPKPKDGDVPPCSPDHQASTFYPLGPARLVQFVLQTRADRYLEVTPSTSVSNAPGTGTATDSSAATCPMTAAAKFSAWAKKQNQPAIDTNLAKPTVLSAASGGKVVIALAFAASVNATQQAAILKEAKTVKGSDISAGSCTFPTEQITVCDASKADCKAAPPAGSP